MARTFRVGIVGAVSSYSLHYGQALRDMPDVELVGLAHLGRDPKYIRDALNLPWLARYPKTAADMAEAFATTLYEKAEDMVANAAPDAVCVCTEDYLHQRYALMALEQGLHVIIPKPFARSRDEAEAIFSAARKKGLVAVGSLPHRFRPPSVTAREAILQGVIGRPVSGHFSIAHHLTLGGWKSDTSMASGPEYEIGFYAFDMLRMMMMSEPETVMGLGANLDHRGIPYIDNGKCLVSCENGALASVDLLMSMHHRFPPASGMHVVGNDGALTIDGNAVVIHSPDGEQRRDIPQWNATERELAAWIELCREGKDATWWQEEGVRTLDLISAYKQAYERGEPVTLPHNAQASSVKEEE